MVDERLVRMAAAARSGGQAEGTALLAEVEPLLRRWAARLLNDAGALDDVVQESLTEIYTTIGELRDPAAIRTWLWLVVRKHADRERRRRRPTVLLDLVTDSLAAEPHDQPAAVVERRADEAMVRQALRLVSDPDRLLLTLRYFGEWSDADLAEQFGISRGAVRKRLYDARKRLRPLLADQHDPSTPKKEAPVSGINELFGTVVAPGASAEVPAGVTLHRPLPAGRLETGLKVLDAVVPWPCGGTVDLLGPVGTGHLVLMLEVLRNLHTRGPAALVAVASVDTPSDFAGRLQHLVGPDMRPHRTVVVEAPSGDEAAAMEYGARLAGGLAAEGAAVLLVVDRLIGERLGTGLFRAVVGVSADGVGSVTGVRVAPHPRDEEPTPHWGEAGATTVLGVMELVAGVFPAVDVLASGSTLVTDGQLTVRECATALACRELLAHAREVRTFLTQPMWTAEPYTGQPGETVAAAAATSGLADLVRNAG